MNEQQTTRADWIFRIVILLLAGLWIAYPPAKDEGPTARPSASLTRLVQP